MSVVFARESYASSAVEAMPLIEHHREEVAEYPDIMLLDVDEDVYRMLEQKDKLHIITARYDGKLIGYIVMIVTTHPHYKKLLIANEDIHYVVPEHRDAATGILLLKHAIKAMKERGCQVMLLRTKVKHNHGRIFERLGFTAMDMVYIKRLDRD